MFPEWLTPELHAELNAHPERMADCGPWFQFLVLHSQWMVINDELQLVLSAADMQQWLTMLRPSDVAPDHVQRLYHLQAHFQDMIEQAFPRARHQDDP
jgi:hypothetical protein